MDNQNKKVIILEKYKWNNLLLSNYKWDEISDRIENYVNDIIWSNTELVSLFRVEYLPEINNLISEFYNLWDKRVINNYLVLIEWTIWTFSLKELNIWYFAFWPIIFKKLNEILLNWDINSFNNYFNNVFLIEFEKIILNLWKQNLPNVIELNNLTLFSYEINWELNFKLEYFDSEENSFINSIINKRIVESDNKNINTRLSNLHETKLDILNLIDFLKVNKNENFILFFDKAIYDIIDKINIFFEDFDIELKHHNKNFYLSYFYDLVQYINSHKVTWSLYKFNEDFIKDKWPNYQWIQSNENFYNQFKVNIKGIFEYISKDIDINNVFIKEDANENIIHKIENIEEIILKKEDLINLKKMINSFIRSIVINSDMTITQLKEQNIFIFFDEMMISLNNNNKIFNKNIYLSYFKNLLEFYANNKKLTLYDYNLIYKDKLEEIIYNFPKDNNRNEHYIILKLVNEQLENKTIFNSDLLSFLENDIDEEILQLDNIIN